jgi:hypothetical protein
VIQARKPVKVEREVYEGPVTEVKMNSVDMTPPIHRNKVDNVIMGDDMSNEFHNRPPTRSGGRNQQDSSFSFSGS